MTSDSLGAGTVMAMCPGNVRQPKWCINPLGGGIRNASPALSADGTELYVLFGGGAIVSLDAQTGAENWRIQLEPKRSIGRVPNHAPVVNPETGRIYVGLWRGALGGRSAGGAGRAADRDAAVRRGAGARRSRRRPRSTSSATPSSSA